MSHSLKYDETIYFAIECKEMSYKVLRDMVNTPTPSGGEEAISQVLGRIGLKGFTMKVAPNNSVCFVMNRGSDRTIIFDAHIDQVHARIRSIRDDGIILARPVGFDSEAFSGQRVKIQGRNRDIEGVIQTNPPHLNKMTTVNNVKKNKFLYVDAGMSKAELEKEVIMGDVILFDSEYKEIGRHYITGPGLDNKASAFVLINLMRRLDGNERLRCNIIVNFSSREEVGGSTIQHLMNQPETKGLFSGEVELIVVDTNLGIKTSSIDDTDLKLDIDLGKGPTIENGTSTSRGLLLAMERIAKRHRIPVQFQYTDFGGTNKRLYDHILNAKGIDIGVPLRNMHSAVETVDKRDLKWTEDLLYYYLVESCQ